MTCTALYTYNTSYLLLLSLLDITLCYRYPPVHIQLYINFSTTVRTYMNKKIYTLHYISSWYSRCSWINSHKACLSSKILPHQRLVCIKVISEYSIYRCRPTESIQNFWIWLEFRQGNKQ